MRLVGRVAVDDVGGHEVVGGKVLVGMVDRRCRFADPKVDLAPGIAVEHGVAVLGVDGAEVEADRTVVRSFGDVEVDVGHRAQLGGLDLGEPELRLPSLFWKGWALYAALHSRTASAASSSLANARLRSRVRLHGRIAHGPFRRGLLLGFFSPGRA